VEEPAQSGGCSVEAQASNHQFKITGDRMQQRYTRCATSGAVVSAARAMGASSGRQRSMFDRLFILTSSPIGPVRPPGRRPVCLGRDVPVKSDSPPPPNQLANGERHNTSNQKQEDRDCQVGLLLDLLEPCVDLLVRWKKTVRMKRKSAIAAATQAMILRIIVHSCQ
jgi:hypothetical protein